MHKILYFLAVDQYANVSVQVVATNPSLEFYKKEDVEKMGTTVWTDANEWTVGLCPSPIARYLWFLFRVHSRLESQFFISNFDVGQTSF